MIRTTLVSALFKQFGSCFWDFLTLQDKHNIHTLFENISHSHSLRNRAEKLANPRLAFLLFFKAGTNTGNMTVLFFKNLSLI